jgi:phosphate transport system substrate-binding protein
MSNQNGVSETISQPNEARGMGGRIAVMLTVGLILGAGIYLWPNFESSASKAEPAGKQLRTGGTSAILVQAENFWKGKYLKDKGVELIFESVGSTPATSGMLEDTYSIAFTHAPASADLREKAKASGREIVHIPLMLCGVAPAYHVAELQGADPLNFTADVLARIFLGKIQSWDDPALKAINPGVKLPAKKIVVVHRNDSSGTTQIFTEYLAAVSPEWQQQVGAGGSKVKWPTGIGAERNQGMHIAINNTDGAIGYVDRMFVTMQESTLDYGAVQNHDKTAFIRAEPANTTAALTAILDKVSDDLTFDLTDKPGKDSYPIAGAIYGLCSSVQPEDKKQQVVDFLRWAVHDGQKSIPGECFAPLPEQLIPRIDKRLDGIKTGK